MNVDQATVLIRGLNHWFGTGENRKQGLTNNNLSLLPGELVVMTGPSGSGKTTILTLIGALRTVQEGTVRVLGTELSGLSAGELTSIRKRIGFIFQAHNLFDSLTALQNVRMAMEIEPGLTASQMDTRAADILKRLGLADRMHYKPAQLSGGQKQRVAIARALVNRPKLVLADEPTAALDKASGQEVVTMFKELAQAEQCTVLLVTHDSRILDVASRIVNMVDGLIASEIQVEETVKIIEFLMKCPLFEKQTPAVLTEISQKIAMETFHDGTSVIRQGEEGDKFYIIRDGEVNVRVDHPDKDPVLLTLGSGSYFGEMALITGEPRSATVTARGDAILYSLKKADFLTALASVKSLEGQLRSVFSSRS
jgi:putative ABC transport system ATP-binding protein